jgi:hypothetical protein
MYILNRKEFIQGINDIKEARTYPVWYSILMQLINIANLLNAQNIGIKEVLISLRDANIIS